MDRNYIIKITVCRPAASLSARRAWIEIASGAAARRPAPVALRKESVDRNPRLRRSARWPARRSPQGERG